MNVDLRRTTSSDPTVFLFWLFAALHFCVWILVPTLTQPNAPLDTIEMLYWGHEWQLGYYKHPPLPGWIAESACLLLGRSAWATYVAAQLCVIACFWAAWQLARDFLKPWQALAAAMLLEASYYYNFTTPELNNNVVSRAFWALTVLFFYRALSCERRLWWMLTGATLALGMLSKYDTLLLGAAMVGFSIINPTARRCWKQSGPYLTIATGFILFAPHLYWLVDNEFPTIRYFLNRSQSNGAWWDHLVNPLRFLVSQIGAVAPIALLSIPLVASWKLRSASSESEKFQRDFLWSMVVGPVAMILFASLVLGFAVRSMWGTALWTFAGVFVLFVVKLRDEELLVRRLGRTCVMAMLLFAASLTARNVVFPHFRGKGSRVHYPGQRLATEVERRWSERNSGPLEIVGGSWWPAANVAFYGQKRTTVFADLDPSKSPWTDDAQLRKSGGVVLWHPGHQGELMLAEIQKRFPTAAIQSPLEIDWQTSADLPPLTVGIAVIDPVKNVARVGRPVK